MEALTQGLMPADILKLLVTNIVAFLLLLWILSKFAWGPLLNVIDGRREKIRSDYAAAAAKVEEAEQFRYDYEVKLAEIKDLERARVQEAVKKGESIAGGIEAEARGKANTFMEKAEAELDREVAEARMELRSATVNMAISAAEKLLDEKLDDARHRQLVEEFIKDLGDIRA